MKTTFDLSLLVLCCCAAQCGEKYDLSDAVKTALVSADEFVLYSLNPKEEKEAKGAFHGFRVLGSTPITKKEIQADLVVALSKGVAENKGVAAGCFEPRHGIRLKQKDKVIDLAICFECMHVYAYVGDKIETALTTRSPQAVFDKVLKDAGVTLTPASTKESAR